VLSPARQVLDDSPQRCPRLQRPLRRALDHRAVGERIGKRHAQFDHVGAAAVNRSEQESRSVERGVTGGEVDYEPFRAACTQVAKSSSDAISCWNRHTYSAHSNPMGTRLIESSEKIEKLLKFEPCFFENMRKG